MMARTRTPLGLACLGLALRARGLRVEQPGAAEGPARSINVTEEHAVVDKAGTSALDNQTQEGESNFCMNGRMAPEFFLIGAQKAGSTAFAEMIKHPKIICPTLVQGEQDSRYYKEVHIFDEFDRFKKGRDFWLSHYPACDRSTRMIAADFTPDYVAVPEVPQRMKAFYGDQTHRLKIALIVRNPVGRIHSAFHFYNSEARAGQSWAQCVCQQKGSNGCTDFKGYVEGLMKIEHNDPCYFVNRSDYSHQLDVFLQVFAPSQFTVFSLTSISDPSSGRSRAAQAVWTSLGLSGEAPVVAHINGGHHASIEQDLGPTVLEQFKSYINDRAGPYGLAKTLVDKGIKLFGFQSNEYLAVAQHLGQTW
eukprot:CAMPEP_0168400584 /NCGR_PEP_ID=MMETSP0228-20121227/22673_1 /TAXON_ID=133427 /ORGANISM="Protoceratium reticulatum, Strain CCCM 535 (=CCMP 1889)" /LENGTH=362 /DNA_ID=CAMNT_0008414129 /DNA_START=83 /DNA_END=1168 /DNA_ORIENTATION=+